MALQELEETRFVPTVAVIQVVDDLDARVRREASEEQGLAASRHAGDMKDPVRPHAGIS
jgi:hypothetical protein